MIGIPTSWRLLKYMDSHSTILTQLVYSLICLKKDPLILANKNVYKKKWDSVNFEKTNI
jgi:hypothetical protein